MIINISAIRDSSGLFQFNLPNLNFDRRFTYKIGVHHLNYRLQVQDSAIADNELLCLHSNLIDRSINNPTQTIAHLSYNSKSIVQNYKPSIVIHHKLQLYEFENASFELRRFFREDAIQLKYIFLQLEILRLDAYGRVQ